MVNNQVVECDFYEENPNQMLFESAEEAWFWFCKYDNRTGYKIKSSASKILRPCFLDDIYLVVTKLYLALLLLIDFYQI